VSNLLRFPKLGVSMTEGTLLEWVVADGARVEAGELIYRLETDKVECDVEAPASGTLRHVGTPGVLYQVGDEIGRIE
jgi:pyruvate/2-oxoglutarate dehydrogenase complex dihydrolipoamide acyltransferase (E2) component